MTERQTDIDTPAGESEPTVEPSSSLTCFATTHPLTADMVRALPANTIDSTWQGETLRSAMQWTLAVDPLALWFCCRLPGPANFDSALRAGQFVEGLWTRDVAELFVRDPHSGQYQEFNLSPAGAWWTCFFMSYRTRSPSTRRPGTIAIVGATSQGTWDVIFGVRRDELSVEINPGTEVHVAGIVDSDDSQRSEKGPRYVSSAPVRDAAPDFHRAECFLPLRFEPLP